MSERSGQATRFGVRVAGRGLLTPAGIACEFVPDARISPLPGARRAVFGLMQRNGWPIPVFALPWARSVAGGAARVPVLVVGVGRGAVAYCVDAAPVAIADAVPEPHGAPDALALPVPEEVVTGRWRGADEAFVQEEWVELDLIRLAAWLGGGA